jgi:hypothetical protein
MYFGIVGGLWVGTCGWGAICDVRVSGYVVERADHLAFTCALSEAPLFTLQDPRGLVTALNKPVVVHGQLERYPVHRRPSVRVCRIEPSNLHGGDAFPLSASAVRPMPCRNTLLLEELYHELRKRQDSTIADTDEDGTPDYLDTDDDDDGMSDVYENENELDERVDDGAGDLDGDGFINLHEYLAGTRANDPNSLLVFSSAVRNGALWTLTWMSVTGKTYDVYASPEPGVSVSLIEGGIPAELGATTSRDVPGAAPRAAFYIRLQP